MEHLAERYGLLTIIVLGESFVKVLSHLSAPGHEALVGDQLKGVQPGHHLLLMVVVLR